MKNLIKKVMLIAIVVIGALIVSGETIYAITTDDSKLDSFKPHIKQNYLINKTNDGYHEILKEEKVLSEDEIVAEITRKAHEHYNSLKEKEREELLEEKKKQEAKKAEPQYITYEATYYSAFCNTCSGTGVTASGVSVAKSIYYKGYRVIAVDPRYVPLYSIVEVITPYESFTSVALDTGGDIKRFRIDILVESDKIAYKLGRHDVKVRIVGKIK